MRNVAVLAALGCVACATQPPPAMVVESKRHIEAVEMLPSSLPELPSQGPRATSGWLVTLDDRRLPFRPGTVWRHGDVVSLRAPVTNEETTLELSALRSAIFEQVDTVRGSRSASVAATRRSGRVPTVVWILGGVLLTGFVLYQAGKD